MAKGALLRTKVTIPPLRRDLIPRAQLSQQLEPEGHQTLTLLAAPAGFGKTTAMARWARQAGAAWLSLDERDNDRSRFLGYLTASLEQSGKQLVYEPSTDAVFTLEESLTPLLAELEEGAPPLLAIDDYHLIQNDEIHEVMCFLIEHWPHRGQIFVASRQLPPFPLVRWRFKAVARVLDVEALRFDPEETAAFLTHTMQLPLSEEQCGHLHAQTEGWVAGLQLAALVDPPQESAVAEHPYILEFMVREVLDRRSETQRRFLFQTALLERFDADLCHALTGLPGCQEQLEDLQRTHLFLVPLDEEGRWFRYHHLFAQALRAEYQRREPEAFLEAHRLASDTFAAQGRIEEAIEHGLAARDWQQVSEIFAADLLPNESAIDYWNVLRWCQQIPREWQLKLPGVGMLEVVARLFIEGPTEALDADFCSLEAPMMAMLSSFEEGHPKAAMAQSLWAHYCLVGVELYRQLDDPRRALALLERAQQLVPEQQRVLQARFATAEGFIRDAAGEDSAKILGFYRRALELLEGHDDELAASIWTVWGLAWAHIERCEHYEASHLCLDLLHRIEQQPEAARPELRLLCPIYATMAFLSLAWDKIEQAEHYGRESIRHLSPSNTWDERFFVQMLWSTVLFARRDLEASALALKRAKQCLKEHSPRGPCTSAEAGLRMMQGDIDAGIRWSHLCHFTLDEPPRKVWMPAYKIHVFALIAQGRLELALEWSRHIQAFAQQLQRPLYLVDGLVLQAITCALEGQHDEAAECLSRALHLTEDSGVIYLYKDHKEALKPAFSLLSKRSEGPGCSRRYFRRVWGALKQPGPSWPTELEPLSDRELEVLQEVAQGLSNRDIAKALHISIDTVKTHLKRTFAKLGVKKRGHAALRAKELGIL